MVSVAPLRAFGSSSTNRDSLRCPHYHLLEIRDGFLSTLGEHGMSMPSRKKAAKRWFSAQLAAEKARFASW